jgi:hypothetical protein
MARMMKNVVVISKPVRTFPNGDYFFIELSRSNVHYTCTVRMACSGPHKKCIVVAKAQGKTIREAEENCFYKALDRCPAFPSPPYVRRKISKRVILSTRQLIYEEILEDFIPGGNFSVVQRSEDDT